MVITLGAEIRGDMLHCDVVVAEVGKDVSTVARDTGIPLIFGVLTTDTLLQALKRAGIKINLGCSYRVQALGDGQPDQGAGSVRALLGVGPLRGIGFIKLRSPGRFEIRPTAWTEPLGVLL